MFLHVNTDIDTNNVDEDKPEPGALNVLKTADRVRDGKGGRGDNVPVL